MEFNERRGANSIRYKFLKDGDIKIIKHIF